MTHLMDHKLGYMLRDLISFPTVRNSSSIPVAINSNGIVYEDSDILHPEIVCDTILYFHGEPIVDWSDTRIPVKECSHNFSKNIKYTVMVQQQNFDAAGTNCLVIRSRNVIDAEIVAGAIFDFAAGLTTNETILECGATKDAAPMVERIETFLESRKIKIESADVSNWRQHVTQAGENYDTN